MARLVALVVTLAILAQTSFVLIVSASLLSSPSTSSAAAASRRAASYARYTTAHSLGDSYTFDARDGWTIVNATNLSYKYRRDDDSPLTSGLSARHNDKSDRTKGSKKSDHSDKPHNAKTHLTEHVHKDSNDGRKEKKGKKGKKGGISASSVGDTIKSAAGAIWNGLKGIGKPEEVKITWYTGHDLENPSCWPNTDWAPTDGSFACALTLVGWHSRPKCFEFLELCSEKDKCVFVRVVDSCAGCDPGSKHVDLTKAAFAKLANIDDGVSQVHMRLSTRPEHWFLDLWGPEK